MSEHRVNDDTRNQGLLDDISSQLIELPKEDEILPLAPEDDVISSPVIELPTEEEMKTMPLTLEAKGELSLEPDDWSDEDNWDEDGDDMVGDWYEEEETANPNDTALDIDWTHTSALYQFHTSATLGKYLENTVALVESKLEVSPGAAEILLWHFNWDSEKLQRTYLPASPEERAKLCVAAGCEKQIQKLVEQVQDPLKEFTCGICFDDFKEGESFSMLCKHRFCLECWSSHLQVALKAGTSGGSSAVFLTCPGFKCPEKIPKLVFDMLLDHEELAVYEKRVITSFVDRNPRFVWCTSAFCDRVIQLKKEILNVICECGNRFCLKCGEMAHAPLNCRNYESWIARDKGSTMLNAKLLKQCKKCPHCGVNTIKDGGCMYMSCTVCGKAWCWQCGLSDHHVSVCNRPKYDNDLLDPEEGDIARYLFYFERYFNHKQSMKFAEEQRQRSQRLAGQIGDFFIRSVNLVIDCRDVLKWTYAHAFYLKCDTQRQLFEYRQAKLEEFTEQLNQITEKQSPEALFLERLRIMEITNAISNYLMGMIMEGLESQKEESKMDVANEKKESLINKKNITQQGMLKKIFKPKGRRSRKIL